MPSKANVETHGVLHQALRPDAPGTVQPVFLVILYYPYLNSSLHDLPAW